MDKKASTIPINRSLNPKGCDLKLKFIITENGEETPEMIFTGLETGLCDNDNKGDLDTGSSQPDIFKSILYNALLSLVL